MVKIDQNVQPVFMRMPDALIVQLTLEGEPDSIWQSLFAVMAQPPNQPDYELIVGKTGTNRVRVRAAVSLRVALSMTDDEAKTLMRRCDEFVNEVEKTHSERTGECARLERAISGLF